MAAFPQTAFAGTSTGNGNGNGNNAAAPGQVKKTTTSSSSDGLPSAGTPTAADNPEDFSNHDATNGPGGQVCDGDPDNEPGAGGNYENTCPDGPSQNGAGDGNANGKPCAGCVGNADDKNPPGQADSGPSDHNNGYECDQKGRSANEGNNGVGYGNPAHTGCEGTPPPPPGDDPDDTCPDGSPMPANGQCKCPDGSTMPSSGSCKCPDGSTMPSSGSCKCPDGSTMPANGQCKCPDGSTMPASGTCSTPCVPTADSVCGQVTPSCVVSATNTCGGATVQGETLGRPVEVLGVQIVAAEVAPETAAAVAPAALAKTGSEAVGFARLGALLTLAGLALTIVTRRRRATVTAE